MNNIGLKRVLSLCLVTGIGLLFPLLFPNPYVLHIVILALMYTILATSLNLVTGYSGLLSLGHQAFFGIGAYTSALLAVDLHLPFIATILAAGLFSAIASYAIGGITLRLRSAYFVISTIAFGEILRLVCLNWSSLTRGPLGIANIPPPSLGPFTFDTPIKAYYLVVFITIISVFITSRMVNSHFGRVLIGLKDAEYVAKAVGINPFKYLLISVIVGGFMAGIAGSFYAHYVKFLSPDVFYFAVAVNLIVMVVGGGIGTIPGPIIGAFIFTILPEILRASAQYRLIIYGLILILVVRFIPGGIWSFAVLCLKKVKKREALDYIPMNLKKKEGVNKWRFLRGKI